MPKGHRRSPFHDYRPYISQLRSLLRGVERQSARGKEVDAALDGDASAQLRRLTPLTTRRQYGAYFTGTALGKRLATQCPSFDAGQRFYDPTCGIGDLLLSVARKLPLGRTLTDTIARWGEQLAGTDLHSEFVQAAKLRLMLLAQQRHALAPAPPGAIRDHFPNIRVGDALKNHRSFRRATTVLMNPPFGLIEPAEVPSWAGGRVTAASVFVAHALEHVRHGTVIIAILPEVLRSGAFSEHWRTHMAKLAEVRRVEPFGVFDESADVDVFILRAVRRHANQPLRYGKWPRLTKDSDRTLSRYFDVHVGRVVPHRDPESGPSYPYIHPRCVPPWSVMRRFSETRKHLGKVYKSPFVVIRRTSRPGHPHRATASIIAGTAPVAVENHFIVCQPKDKTLRTCKRLMAKLKSRAVNQYLDGRIRCRHLTVEAVKDIPISLPDGAA